MRNKIMKISALVLIGMLVAIMMAMPAVAPKAQRWKTNGNNAPPNAVLGTLNERPLRIITFGTAKMVVTTTGDVGIGIATPTEKLDVLGNVHASGGFIAGSSTTYGDGVISLSSGTDLSISKDSSTPVTLRVENTANYPTSDAVLSLESFGTVGIEIRAQRAPRKSIIDIPGGGIRSLVPSGGSVGIGTTNPGPFSLLTVQGDSDTMMELESTNPTKERKWGFQVLTSGSEETRRFRIVDLTDGFNSGERLTIMNNGNVGIGTASPTSPLQVVGLPVYANNAAAIAGGLTPGAFYRTGGDPDPVCVVH
jgi:hypothetical protein